MNTLRITLPAVFVAICVALSALVLPVSAGAEEVVIHYTKEGYPVFVQQLSSGQVAAVTFNKRIRSMRITLKNGQHVLAVYPRHQSEQTIAKVRGDHVAVTILTPSQAKKEQPKGHHKLRYIAGGVLLLVIIIVGAVLLVNRKRSQSRE